MLRTGRSLNAYERGQAPLRASPIPHHILIIANGSADQKGYGVLGLGSITETGMTGTGSSMLRLTETLCLRRGFVFTDACRVDVAALAAGFFAPACFAFVFWVCFIYGQHSATQ